MRFYRALLYLYPSGFRREYGGEMQAAFAARRRSTSGLGQLLLWLETIPDAVLNALAVHWDLLRQDLRYTVRALARTPGFALTAVLVTALGVGANTAAFSIADFVLVRPLPFRDSDRLVRLWERPSGGGQNELSPPDYHDWKAMSASFEAMGAYHGQGVNLVAQADPERVEGALVTADLLPMLGVEPILGRLFSAKDEAEGAEATAVISHGLWQAAFGGDGGVLGKRVLTDGAPRVIVGVMPSGFHFPNRDVEIWLPMPLEQQADTDRTNNWFQVVARLRPEVTLRQAAAEMNVIAARLEHEHPKELEKVGATLYRLRDDVSQSSRLLLLALCGAAACVLLIACANLASLLLARSLARSKELVVRAALGAGRERLARQLVTESSLIALLGGVAGVMVAVLAVPLLARLVPATLPIAKLPSVDLRVLLFAGALTALTGFGFGVLPALRASGKRDMSALRDDVRSGGGQRASVRSALVVAEIVASVVLLVSAGLLMRALWRIQGTDPGFQSDGVLTLRTALPSPRYDDTAEREKFYTRVLSAVRETPGVSSAAYISFLPMAMRGGIWPVLLPGGPATRSAGNTASLRYVTPGFFAVLGIPILKGRDISEADDVGHPPAAVVSEAFAGRYWPKLDPLGRKFKFAFDERTVVGVVKEIRVRGLEQDSEPQVYLSYRQVADGSIIAYTPKDLVIRTSLPPLSLLPRVRSIVRDADPEQPISEVRTLADVVSSETATRSVQLRVLGAFALVALLLAAVGIHGLLSFSVAERQREIGVRMALGAEPRAIVRMVMSQGVRLALAGVVPGVLLAYAAGRGMEALLAGVHPADPLTFGSVGLLCACMTLAGSLAPVLRAARVSPADAFRVD